MGPDTDDDFDVYDFDYDDDDIREADEDSFLDIDGNRKDADMQEVVYCCGAYSDNSGSTIKSSRANNPGQYLLDSYRAAFLFSGTPQPGFTKVNEDLYVYAHNSERFGEWSPTKPYELLDDYLAPAHPNYYTDPQWATWMESFCNDLHTINTTRMIGNFPYQPYDFIPASFAKHVKTHGSKHDLVLILASAQHETWAAMVEDAGFVPVKRAKNPKHNTKLTFYHRPAGGVKVDYTDIPLPKSLTTEAEVEIAL